MFAILIYHEHDADTSVNGPYADETAAMANAHRMAVDLAAGVEGRIVREIEDGYIVFNSEYEETEPTDDDWHVTLEVTMMGQPLMTDPE